MKPARRCCPIAISHILVPVFLLAGSADALTIQFDYTYDTSGFFSGANIDRRAVLDAAASVFENRLGQSQIAPITPDANNTWSLLCENPSTGAGLSIDNLVVPANTITIFVGARDLPGTTLGLSTSGYSWSGFQPWADLFGSKDNATHFESFGGSIAFDSLTNWYFDNDTSTTENFPGQTDFFSVAEHEICHILGFNSGAMAFAAQTVGSNFVGLDATTMFGGPVPLANPDHYAQGLISPLDNREVIMDPAIAPNTRKPVTELDLAALQDIGYTVTPMIYPASGSTDISTSKLIAGIVGSSASSVHVDSGVMLNSGNIIAGSLSIDGTIVLQTQPSPNASTSFLTALIIAHSSPTIFTGKLDLTNNKLIVQAGTAGKASTISNLNAAITAGSNGATWTGNGITSSTAAADTAHLGIGVFDNTILQKSSFGNQTLNSDSILITVAHLGDANDDGVVDLQDLSIVTNHWQGSQNNWAAGDLNRDGVVDLGDLSLVTNNWQQTSNFDQTALQMQGTPGVAVPEPACALFLTASGMLALACSGRMRRPGFSLYPTIC